MVVETPSIQWVIGVSLAFSADVVGNVGVQILKIAHGQMIRGQSNRCVQIQSPVTVGSTTVTTHKLNDKLLAQSQHKNKICYNSTQQVRQRKKIRERYIFHPLWITGTILQFLGSLLDFFAVGFAPQSVVAPIGSLVVVINLVFTALFQNEIPSKRLIATTSIVVLGSFITTLFSPKNHSNYQTVEQLVELYGSVYFIFYALLIGLMMISLLLYHKYCKKYKAKYAIEYERKYFKSHRFAVAALSGIMGAQNILFAKGVSSMIVFSVSNNTSCFIYWEFYLLLLCMVSTVWFQLKWLNYGLKHFSPMQIIPVFQSFWTLIGILGGLIVYQEFNDFPNVKSKCLFAFGCMIIIGGILYLTTLETAQKYKQNETKQSTLITDGHSVNDIVSIVSGDTDEMDYYNQANNKLNSSMAPALLTNGAIINVNNLTDSVHTNSS